MRRLAFQCTISSGVVRSRRPRKGEAVQTTKGTAF